MNTKKLEAAIVASGLTKREVAIKIGITPKTFYKKMKKGAFGTDEVINMVDLLNIKNPSEIFFAK